MGAITGLAAFGVWTAMFLLTIVLNGPEMRDNVRKSMQEWVTQYPSPQASQVVDFVSTPEGFATLITVSIVMALTVFLVGSAFSGAIAGVVFGKDSP